MCPEQTLTTFECNTWLEASGIADARKLGLNGQGVYVGVLDTGVDADHDEFRSYSISFRHVAAQKRSKHLVTDVRGFDTQGHGSHVSAIIAGAKMGIAPEVSLSVGAICESDSDQVAVTRFENGLKWVMDRFKEGEPAVLNLSVGYFRPANFSDNQFEEWVEHLRRTMIQLEEANVLVIESWEPTYQLPAQLEEVLAVGALDNQFARVNPGVYATRHPDLWGLGSGIGTIC